MGDYLRGAGFKLDEGTFKDSPEYINALIEFYNSFLAFWSRALRFSKRKWYQNFTLAMWSNYDAEFEAFSTSMQKHKDAVTECAGAVDRQRSHAERIKAEAARKGMLVGRETLILIGSRQSRRKTERN